MKKIFTTIAVLGAFCAIMAAWKWVVVGVVGAHDALRGAGCFAIADEVSRLLVYLENAKPSRA